MNKETPTNSTPVATLQAEPTYKILSQRQLIWRKFKRHRLALICFYALIALYIVVIFAEFFASYGTFQRHSDFLLAPPTTLHFVDENGVFHLRPFVYKVTNELNRQTFTREYVEDTSEKYDLHLFVHGEPYLLLGFIQSDIHFFGVDAPGNFFLFGTDALGRDVFSRMLLGARTSLFVGLLGLSIGFVLGLFFGGISGYYGGNVDLIVQRITEFLQSLPTLPLWMALAALVPAEWTPIQVYFGISSVLAIIGWTGLARVIWANSSACVKKITSQQPGSTA